MKTTQIRAEEGLSVRRDVSEQCPGGGNHRTTANIDDVLRQIIREELAELKISQRESPVEDQLLTASQAAKLLHVSERWLYKHASTLPYAVRLSETVVRFSRNKIQAEIQRKLKMQSS
jgi:predicted DNA-binding transcriptional regulator AlpA